MARCSSNVSDETTPGRKAEVVNGLLWVAAKRTFTSPGPWPLKVVRWWWRPSDFEGAV